jgi:hypothetical protein
VQCDIDCVQKQCLNNGMKLNISKTALTLERRDSPVGIATGYGMDDQGVGVRVPVGITIFTSSRRRDRLWGPPSLLSNGYRGLIPGVKRPERKADYSPATNAEFKKT